MLSIFVRAINSNLGRALTLAVVNACLLLPLLSQPLWRDEGSTFIDVSQPNLAGVLDSVRINELTPPLYFVFEHFWIRFAGTTEFALRFPSLIAAAFAIALLYDTARRVRSTVAGYATAACAGLAPLTLLVGSEARAYATTLLLGALVMWLVATLLLAPPAKAYLVAVILAFTIAAFSLANYTAWPAIVGLLVVTPVISIGRSPRSALLLFITAAVGATTMLPMASDFVSAGGSIHVQYDSATTNIVQKLDARLFWFNPLVIAEPAFTAGLVGGTLTWLLRLRPFTRGFALLAEDQFLIVCFGIVLLGVGASIQRSLPTHHHLAAYAPAAWLIIGNYYARFATWLVAGRQLRTLPLLRKLGLFSLATTSILAFSEYPLVYASELKPRSGSLSLVQELKRRTPEDLVIIAVPDRLSPSLYYYLRNDHRITLRGIATWSKPWYYYHTSGWEDSSLEKHFLRIIDDEARHRRVAFAVDWGAHAYNGHRYDVGLDIAREESARRGVAFRRTFHGTIETMDLILLAPERDPSQGVLKRQGIRS